MVAKGYKRLWILRRLKNLGASIADLLDVYCKQVRSILEFGVPVWHSGITKGESKDIELVQKAALHIILGSKYSSYKEALQTMDMKTLADRRTDLCLKFAKKSAEHPVHNNWYKPSKNVKNTRSKNKYQPVISTTTRFQNSPISFLTSLLNSS